MEKITFTILPEHLKLISRFYVDWEHGEYGAPSIDSKRPYGNSDVELDIARILGWNIPEDEELTDVQSHLAEKLHKETQTALQICLIMQKFEVGEYEKLDRYRDRSWAKIREKN